MVPELIRQPISSLATPSQRQIQNPQLRGLIHQGQRGLGGTQGKILIHLPSTVVVLEAEKDAKCVAQAATTKLQGRSVSSDSGGSL